MGAGWIWWTECALRPSVTKQVSSILLSLAIPLVIGISMDFIVSFFLFIWCFPQMIDRQPGVPNSFGPFFLFISATLWFAAQRVAETLALRSCWGWSGWGLTRSQFLHGVHYWLQDSWCRLLEISSLSLPCSPTGKKDCMARKSGNRQHPLLFGTQPHIIGPGSRMPRCHCFIFGPGGPIVSYRFVRPGHSIKSLEFTSFHIHPREAIAVLAMMPERTVAPDTVRSVVAAG